MVKDPSCSVAECWKEGSWVMDFKKTLSMHEYNSWLELVESLQGVTLDHDSADSVRGLEKKK